VLPSLKRPFFAAILIVFSVMTAAWLWSQAASLNAITVGTGSPAVVLLHGYGSRAEDWLQFADDIRVPNNGRLIFPQGPLRGPFSGSRGWWWLNLEGHVTPGRRTADFSMANPGGIKVASRLVRNYLRGVEGPIVLGGFSQGAMVSAEIAFQTEQDLAGLVLLGGTTVNEAAWVQRLPGRRSLPIFIAHGRRDGVLPFEIAERFAASLMSAGLNVTWYPFDGGHDISAGVVRELNAFLQRSFTP
jgi:phospholipase/carboxylesterase